MARLVGSDDVASIAEALSDAIDVAVGHEGTCLLVFHHNASPAVLHHTLEPAGRRHYVDRYLAGPYLLDPLYLLAVRDDCPGICRFREASPDRFRSSEYYRQYCERTHLRDEMDFLVRVSADSTLVLVVGRRTRQFSKAELARLELIEVIVHAAMRRIWERWSTNGEPATEWRKPAPATDGLLRSISATDCLRSANARSRSCCYVVIRPSRSPANSTSRRARSWCTSATCSRSSGSPPSTSFSRSL